MKIICLLISFLVILCSCSSLEENVEIAINHSGKNIDEIKGIIHNYNKTDIRHHAAEFLIGNMIGLYSASGEGIDSIESLYRCLPNGKSWQFDSVQLKRLKKYENLPIKKLMDLESVKRQYIISNINDSWNYKNIRSWNNNLTTNQYCELLLPYRIGNEQLTNWRKAYRKKFKHIEKNLRHLNNSVEAAAVVSNAIGKLHFNQQLNTPHRTALDLLESPIGYCREDCDRTLYAMRAFGIPVTIDKILVSPDHGKSHMWNVVYDTDDEVYRLFDNYRNPPTRNYIYDDHRSKGKVYRMGTAINHKRFSKIANIEYLPDYFKDPRIYDVTDEYFGANKVEVKINTSYNNVYLGIFTPDGFLPVDMGEERDGFAIFKNIEPNIIFFPITHNELEFIPCGMPFLIDTLKNVQTFIPNETKQINIQLTRKMPITFNLKEKLSSVIGTKIEIGETEDGPWTMIDSIISMPTNNYYKIPIKNYLKYIRISSLNKQKPEIGEIIAASDSLGHNKLKLSLVNAKNKGKWKNLTDGDILSWYHYVAGKKGLIFRNDSKETANYIFLIPRNDDNFVVPNNQYELLYFNSNGWISLGKKLSTNFRIDYKIPENAVFWLRNVTKGKEEQIFICRDGKQLFNVDL